MKQTIFVEANLMILKIPMRLFQLLSILLFFIILFSPAIQRSIKSIESLTLDFGFPILLLFLNVFVVLGFYKLSIENNIIQLKRSSLLLAIVTFLVSVSLTILQLFYSANDIIHNPILYIPNFILGIAILIFSISLFKIKIINNKNSLPFAIIILITGLIYLSYFGFSLYFIVRWFYYGALSYFLFPKK